MAVFDIWSLEHFIAGICVGAFIPFFYRPKSAAREIRLQHYLLWVLAIAFAWEMLEHYLETGLAGTAVTYWFQGVEYHLNRMVSDPILMVMGSLVVRANPHLAWPARLFSSIWLVVHIFVFEHSMVLHDMLGI